MATPSKTKKVMVTVLAGLGITAGAAGIAAAATSQTTPPDPAAAQQHGAENTDKEQSPDYKSSVTVAQTPDNGTESDDAAEAAKLAPLAKVTPEQAAAAATAAVPGKAGPAELNEENGNVVYKVEVTQADGKTVEVTIDAGNAKVLAQDSEEADDANEAKEGPEADEAKGAHETKEAHETGGAKETNKGAESTPATPGN